MGLSDAKDGWSGQVGRGKRRRNCQVNKTSWGV
jgi:hypothetical protein